MPRIPNAPSVRTFTETWSSDFKEAVKKAAGKDGRLTMNEAKKLGERPDADKVFADNAVNYLKATGKQSVSVEVLATSAKAYAQRQAELAAGADGKISLADGAKLPADLRDDFFMLRGKTAPGVTPAPSLICARSSTTSPPACGCRARPTRSSSSSLAARSTARPSPPRWCARSSRRSTTRCSPT
jgi:hypothetical protein